jgi:TPR repeat protein
MCASGKKTEMDKDQDQSENPKTQKALSDALRGGLNAQFELARSLEADGDFELACGWYKKAAMQGHNEAAYCCGMLCLKMKGEPMKEAAYWLGRAATAGHVNAQHQLAVVLGNGYGVKHDPEESLRWHRIAASYGHKESKDKLEKLSNFLGN